MRSVRFSPTAFAALRRSRQSDGYKFYFPHETCSLPEIEPGVQVNPTHATYSIHNFSGTQNSLPSALEGRQARECPICATHGLNALASAKHRLAGSEERLECQSFWENNERHRLSCDLHTFLSSFSSKICLLRIAEISRQIGEILSGVPHQNAKSKDALAFCLLDLSILNFSINLPRHIRKTGAVQ